MIAHAHAQADFFSDDLVYEAPSTEGIKYAGSKLKLIPQILRLAGKVKAKTFLDGFSGTTRVSQAFAQCGYDVICTDHAVWSEVFGTCYLKGNASGQYRALIDHLNALAPRDGWFTEFYGGDAQFENSMPFGRRSKNYLLIPLRSAWRSRA
jgi:adenine-specific DNA methylase